MVLQRREHPTAGVGELASGAVFGILFIHLMQMLVCPGSAAPPAMRETLVPSLGWEDPLEEEMAPHSSILAWRISWTEEPGWLQSMGSQRARHDRVT